MLLLHNSMCNVIGALPVLQTFRNLHFVFICTDLSALQNLYTVLQT